MQFSIQRFESRLIFFDASLWELPGTPDIRAFAYENFLIRCLDNCRHVQAVTRRRQESISRLNLLFCHKVFFSSMCAKSSLCCSKGYDGYACRLFVKHIQERFDSIFCLAFEFLCHLIPERRYETFG